MRGSSLLHLPGAAIVAAAKEPEERGIVARMERSEIRGGTAGSNADPGLRFAPSGLRLLGQTVRGQGRSVGKDSRDIIRELEADGWYFVGASGSHHHFKHPTKPGKVTLPHPRKDLHPKTLKSIYRQAQLQQKR
jgi:predicted RNA binding protein YcfA (HicA-like mRNA interferase family)